VKLPPLSLYIHIPWCQRKCPYCDFNSHAVSGEIDEAGYVEALLADLSLELEFVGGRPLQSIFIGGGTPSLFSPAAIGLLLDGVEERLPWVDEMEITLEANPGAVESEQFAALREAGVNRLSIGVQSFHAESLRALGRIHGPQEALRAVELAKRGGFERINLDLMFGLPGQTLAQAREDMRTAIELDTEHLSYYQLTLEPNTLFHHQPPALPDEDSLWAIQEQGLGQLQQAGFEQYEVSAFARPRARCRHNLNYWRFGDYIGIGAGAHGKLTLADGAIQRRWKLRGPSDYLQAAAEGGALQGCRHLGSQDLVVEFMMNALRLSQGVESSCFEATTGLSLNRVAPMLEEARERGLLSADETRLRPTPLGFRFLTDLLGLFEVV
jgi:oxygen-independent coproporphyrinogen-3 oxidase